MAVKLDYALCDDILVHISERIQKSKVYKCPICKESVISRKGSDRLHHFAHHSGSECSVSEETLLHFYSKYYLASHKDVSFFFSAKQLSSIDFTLKSMKLSYLPIKLDDILSYYYLTIKDGMIEEKVNQFQPDLLFEHKNDYDEHHELAIEVFVTHQIEEEKRAFFIENDIPFIEVSPTMIGSRINFEVTEFSLPDFMEDYQQSIIDQNVNYTYKQYYEDLIARAKEEAADIDQVNINKEKALSELLENVQHLNLRNYINREIYNNMIGVPCSAKSNYAGFDWSQKVTQLKRVRKGFLCNNHFVYYNTDIFLDLLENFMEQGIEFECLLKEDAYKGQKGIVGFDFTLPNTKVTGEEMKRVLNEMINEMLMIEKQNTNDTELPF